MCSIVGVSAKCKWNNVSTKCDLNWMEMPTTGTSGVYKSLVETAANEDTCMAITTSTGCAAVTTCVFMASEGKCIIKTPAYVDMYGDTSTCSGYYKYVFNGCDRKTTEADCVGACKWRVNERYDEDDAAVNRYDEETQRCLSHKDPPGRCEFSSLKAACGNSFNVTATEENRTYNPQYGGWYDCASVNAVSPDDDNALTDCLVSKGMCASVLTADVLTVFRTKLDGTFDETENGEKYFTAVKACVAEKLCVEYADAAMPERRPACDGKTVEADCEAVSGCTYIDDSCRVIRDIRNEIGADDRGSVDSCKFVKLQKIKGVYDLTDAAVVNKVKAKRAAEEKCRTFNENGQATSSCTSTAADKCEIRTHTDYSCDSNGAAKSERTLTQCEYDEDDAEQKQAEWDLWLGEDVGAAMLPIVDSCEDITTQTTCEAATLTAAETSSLVAATGVASYATNKCSLSPSALALLGLMLLACGQ